VTIIDAHVHIGRFMPPFREGSNDAVADLIDSARSVGISRMVVTSLGNRGYSHYPTPQEFREGNDHVLEAMARFPDILIGFCYVNPRHKEESLDEIERCIVAGGMKGIKLWISQKASDPVVDPVMERAAALGVPVLQHAWYKTTGNYPDESTPADVAEMARRHPTVNIIMAHLHGAGYRGVIDIAPYPNLHVDTSGGDPESTVVEFAVKELGEERVVFGSDAPGRSFGVQLGKVLGADISEAQKDFILYGNMERILKIWLT